LHFVPVDFTRESIAEALKRSAFDPRALSFFSWMGVAMYLTWDEVYATLRAVANIAPAGSMVVFDYLDTDAFIPQKAAPRVYGMIEGLRIMGEPLLHTGFDPLTLAPSLAPLGLHLREDLSPWDITLRYFMGRSDHYRATEHAHIACAVVG
jgi:O-methyltransferase involved in polyketide biosynthesis